MSETDFERHGVGGLKRLLGRGVSSATFYRYELFQKVKCDHCGNVADRADYNYCQVFRTRRRSDETKEQALERHREKIEHALALGNRSLTVVQGLETTFTGGRSFWETKYPKGQGIVMAFKSRELTWMNDEWLSDLGWRPTE